MLLKESYICPVCGKTHTRILMVQTLMDDVRYDVFKCDDCSTTWRVYYKVSNVTTELVASPGSEDKLGQADTCMEDCSQTTEE